MHMQEVQHFQWVSRLHVEFKVDRPGLDLCHCEQAGAEMHSMTRRCPPLVPSAG